MFKLQGFVEEGNTTLSISGGIGSISQKVQGSYPGATITVYEAGTLTLASIYSDTAGTPKANPFTAASDGTWYFYAHDGRYDVRFSGAGIATPFTLSDLALGAGGGVSDTYNYYVDPAGDDGNDGLTVGAPFQTIQKAFDTLAEQVLPLRGTWIINLAAGTYTEGAGMNRGITSTADITIQGPVAGHPNVPTAIIDGTTAVEDDGLAFNSVDKVLLKDIKIQNFSDAGVDATETIIDFTNVHVDSCRAGYYMKDHVLYRVAGGIITNCTMGVHELYGVVRAWVWNTTSLAEGLQISGCTYGLMSKENCTGHTDYSTIDSNTYGIYLSRSCSVNATNSRITNNNYGVVAGSASQAVLNSVDFGIGTADENVYANYLFVGNSNLIGPLGTGNNENTVLDPQFGMQEKQLGYFAGTVSHTGDTAETTLATLGSTRSGGLALEGQYIKIRAAGYKTGAAGVATLRIALAGSNMSNVVLPADTTNFVVEFVIAVIDWTNQTCFAVARCQSTTPVVFGRGTRTIDFNEAVDRLIYLNVELGDGADTVTIVQANAYTNDR